MCLSWHGPVLWKFAGLKQKWGHNSHTFRKPGKPLEAMRTAESLGPATFLQLPRSSTWFLSCFCLYSHISKHVVFNDKHLFHNRTPLYCFVAFSVCSRNAKLMGVFPRGYPATTVSQILSWRCPLATYLPHATMSGRCKPPTRNISK